jgi:hypothetical protein
MTLETALYLLRQTQILRMQIGLSPRIEERLAELEEFARTSAASQRAASDWLERNKERLSA